MIGRRLAVVLGPILVLGVAMGFIFRGPGDAAALWASAGVALAVQFAAFSLVGMFGRATALVARMALGTLVRFGALAVYGILVGTRVIALPPMVALVSLFVFFFSTTLLEPLFIRS